MVTFHGIIEKIGASNPMFMIFRFAMTPKTNPFRSDYEEVKVIDDKKAASINYIFGIITLLLIVALFILPVLLGLIIQVLKN